MHQGPFLAASGQYPGEEYKGPWTRNLHPAEYSARFAKTVWPELLGAPVGPKH
jgi:hypothetical protein